MPAFASLSAAAFDPSIISESKCCLGLGLRIRDLVFAVIQIVQKRREVLVGFTLIDLINGSFRTDDPSASLEVLKRCKNHKAKFLHFYEGFFTAV